jgi:1-deoxy-D-xylulose-5-phosphate reductoisomerase
MKKIILLGSTGSIGRNTLKVVRHLSSDFQVAVLAARSNIDLLEEQIQEFHPEAVVIGDTDKALEFQKKNPQLKVLAGVDGLCEAAAWAGADIVVFAMTGTAALKPALMAIDRGKTLAIANKELLVSAGELIMQRAREKKVSLIPIDSEHSAIFQCLQGPGAVRRLIVTASGGPFRTYSVEQLSRITVAQALTHPNFRMGMKNTIDSSTLMNKGLEVIEAYHLFGVPSIDVIVHPQQLVHSMVEFQDGSVMAQISAPDMCLPIQYALTFPKRLPGLLEPFDFRRFHRMDFEEPDREKFPCLRLAEESLKQGKSYPCFLNAANEILVDRFLKEEIQWMEISHKLDKLISSHKPLDVLTLDSILAVDQEAREKARKC